MNEVTSGGANVPAIPQGAWGAEGAHQSDILVPRIQLLQDLSKPVKEGKAKAGMLWHSVNGVLLADVKQPLEIIPVTTFREWIINDVVGKSEKFRGRVPVTPQNEGWAKEDVENGLPVRRTKCINFFVLIPKYLNEFPFLLSFKKSYIQAGKQLSTHFQMSAMRTPPTPPASQVFNLTSQHRSWEGNEFFGLAVEQGRKSTEAELAVAYKWYQTLSRETVQVAEEGDLPF